MLENQLVSKGKENAPILSFLREVCHPLNEGKLIFLEVFGMINEEGMAEFRISLSGHFLRANDSKHQ